MDKQVIITKRGVYGRVNVTLPISFKIYVLDLQKKSGMKKAEFLRIALMIGVARLIEKVLPKDQIIDGDERSAYQVRT